MNATTVDFIVNAPPAALLAAKLTFLLFGAWAIHFGLARLSPRWRVLLWRAATVGILALPLLAVLSPALRVGLPVRPEPVIDQPLNFEVPPLLPPPVLQPRFETLPDADLPPAPLPAPPARWDLRLAVIWITGAILLALRFIYAQHAMGCLSRRAALAPEAIQQVFSRIAAQTGLNRVRLAVSEQVRSPLLHGLRRPVVLLPGGMTRPEYAPDLPAIFAHELSHAAARDLAWLGLVRLVQFALWPHPLVWRMHAACAAATERACDAAAAGIIDDREVYSRSLARVALALAGRPVGQAALAMAIPDIRRRLLALKNAPSITPPRRGAVRLVVLFALAMLVALSSLKPVRAEVKPVEKVETEAIVKLDKPGAPIPLETFAASLRPRNTKAKPADVQAWAGRIAHDIQTFLAARGSTLQTGKTERYVHYDPATLQIEIHDTRENIGRVGQYLESLPAMAGRTRQEVVFLKHARAEDLAQTIATRTIPESETAEEILSLAPGQERQIADMTVKLLLTEPADMTQLKQESASLSVTRQNRATGLTIEPGTPRLAQNCQLTAEEIPAAPSGSAPVRLKVRYPKNPATRPTDALMLTGINISPFGERNALVLRYTDPEAFRIVMDLIAKLDQPNPGTSIPAQDKSTAKADSSSTQTLSTRQVRLSQTQFDKIRILYKSGELAKAIWGDTQPPSSRCVLELVKQNKTLSLTGEQVHINRLDSIVASLKSAEPMQSEVKVLKIKPQSIPRVMALWGLTPDSPQTVDRTILINGDNLIIRDAPVNVRKIEELLREKQFLREDRNTIIQKMNASNTAPKLDIENFSLLPPGGKTASAKYQALARRVVEAIKVFLYSQTGETKAREEGRQLWFDPGTLQLTIVDTPENLARVRQYLDALPEPLNPKQRQEVIFLKFAVAADAALMLMNQITLPEKEYAVTMQLNEHSETQIGSPGAGLPKLWNLEFEVRSVSPGDMRVPPEQRKDGSANLIVRAGGKPQQQVVAQGTKLSAGGHEITVEEIGCDVTKPERRWVRVRMTFRTQPVEEALPGARRIPGLTIEPVNDLNALIVRYDKPDDMKTIQAMVKDLDVPIKQISVETMFIQPAVGAVRPFDPVADLGATMREFKSSEILRSQDEKAQPAMKPIRLPVIMDLTYEKQEGLRSLGVIGPKVTSLNKREAVFRIDALAPKKTPRQVIHDKTTILRVTPEIGKDGKTIRLKNVWLEILDLTKDASGRERAEPTARQFDIEVRNGESVLLTGPEFKGQYVLLTPYLVE